ncbi:MAG: hypothetical protein KDM91_08650 [Verrucomicrobiae bacterium]|nr:hypothetical protein [Verrucomicrobiae bacterium]MCP5551837.1 hypothetical protein [Akkermansiaceae bacterium]
MATPIFLIWLALTGLLLLVPDIFAGWYSFMVREFPRITWNGFAVAQAVFAFGITMGGFHYLATVFSGRRRRWRWRWTVGFNGMLLLLFAAAISMTGIVHQAAWLSREPLVTNKNRALEPCWEILRTIETFKSTHGRHPRELSELKVKERKLTEYFAEIFSEEYLTKWIYLPPRDGDDTFFLMSGERLGGFWFVWNQEELRSFDDTEAARLLGEHLSKLSLARSRANGETRQPNASK